MTRYGNEGINNDSALFAFVNEFSLSVVVYRPIYGSKAAFFYSRLDIDPI